MGKIFEQCEQIDLFGNTEKENIELSLFDKFIIPPFSIFDTRQGYWQNRKRIWLALGIKSEIGRDSKCYHIQDWANQKGKSMPNDISIFDPVICEICYKWFNVDNGLVLDPFAGGSVRGIVATKLGYDYVGIDLRKEQVQANYNNAQELNCNPKWYCDDAVNLYNYVSKESVDLIFTCPPYFDLEKYSDDPKDLSNMDYKEFANAYEVIIQHSVWALKNNRFAIFVVGDVRDKNGFMVSLRDLTIKCFEKCGVKLYNDIVLATSLASASLRAEKPFAINRKITKVHQYILVFYKGDTKEIKNNFKDLDLEY